MSDDKICCTSCCADTCVISRIDFIDGRMVVVCQECDPQTPAHLARLETMLTTPSPARTTSP